MDTLHQRVSTIESFIKDDATIGPVFLDSIPVRSWAHRTIIRPVTDGDGFDADVLVHITEQTD